MAARLPQYNLNRSSISVSSSFPFLHPSRSIGGRSRPGKNSDYDPEEIVDYNDQYEIRFEHDIPPRLPANSAPSQTIALEANDPWAFLQGTQQKLSNHQVPTFRAMASTGAPFMKYQIQRVLREPEQMNSSTITEREREIFTRIFETILSEKSTFSPRTVPTTFLPSTSLNALFESAVGPQQSGSEISFGPKDSIDKASVAASLAMASSFEEYPAALRAAAAKAAGLIRPARTVDQKQALVKNLAGLIEAMNNCQTDLALGKWMDDNVFNLIEKVQSKGSKDLLSGSYAYLLAEGMKILRTNFNDLAGVISTFQRVKKLGAESYVLGCSVDVYNQVIAAKWEGYRDLYKIKELVDEMEINGIQGDEKTVRVLQEVLDDFATMNSLQAHPALRTVFIEGNEGLLEQLNYKVDIWNIPQNREDPITESLSDMSD